MPKQLKYLCIILPISYFTTVYAQAPWPKTGTNSGISWVQYRNSNGTVVSDVSGEKSIQPEQDICSDSAAGVPGSVFIESDNTNIFFRIVVGAKPTNAQGGIANSVGYIVEISDATGIYKAAVALVKSSKDEICVTTADGVTSNVIYSSPTTAIRATQIVPGSVTDNHWYVDFQTTIASITAVWQGYSVSTATKYYFGATSGNSKNAINKDWMGGNVSTADWTTIALTKATSINTGTLFSSFISGTVTGAGTGTVLNYTDTTAKTFTTDISNNYSFPISFNWSGTITPSKQGYTFAPVNRTYSNILTDQASQNYTVDKIQISGTTSVGNVTLSYVDGTTKQVISDGSGNYTFWVPYNWSGNITPSKSKLNFLPQAVYLLIQPKIINFIPTINITGNTGMGGSTVTCVYNSTTLSITQGATGNFSFSVPYNISSVIITPTLLNYHFIPASMTVNLLAADTVLITFDSVLPVELSSFSLHSDERNIYLQWGTKTEKNSNKSDIERKTSFSNWETIGSVKADQLSNSPKQYGFTDKNLQAGHYEYRLKLIDNDGTFVLSKIIGTDIALPKNFDLRQNYPNPFNPSTKIEYNLPFDSKVTLEIFNIMGESIGQLVNKNQTAGYYSVDFNSSSLNKNISSGIYLYRITTTGNAAGNNFSSIKKMVLVK